ncbi:unnamed protein product, partial [Polarella glacialis]
PNNPPPFILYTTLLIMSFIQVGPYRVAATINHDQVQVEAAASAVPPFNHVAATVDHGEVRVETVGSAAPRSYMVDAGGHLELVTSSEQQPSDAATAAIQWRQAREIAAGDTSGSDSSSDSDSEGWTTDQRPSRRNPPEPDEEPQNEEEEPMLDFEEQLIRAGAARERRRERRRAQNE